MGTNDRRSKAKRDGGARPAKPARARKPASGAPVLLTGGNPQIAKGDGDGPVRAWLDALPAAKRELARRLDALIVRSVPGVRKAVKWNSPFYGLPGGVGRRLHAFTKYGRHAFRRRAGPAATRGGST
jgi:hypothetical protein